MGQGPMQGRGTTFLPVPAPSETHSPWIIKLPKVNWLHFVTMLPG